MRSIVAYCAVHPAVCRCYTLCPKNTGRPERSATPQSLASHFPFAFSPSTAASASGEVTVFCRKCSLFAGGTVDHLIGSRVRGMSPGSALLSWRDLRSTPDRRSPVSCFSFSDRVSVPDRRSFEARLSSPDRFSSLPIVVSVGLPRIMLDRARLSHESRPGGLAIWVGSSGAFSAI